MHTSSELIKALRKCAQELNRQIDETHGNPTTARDQFTECFTQLLKLPNLRGVGMPRSPNHGNEGWILHYDPQLMIFMATSSKGHHDSPHNHGTWVATGCYEGSVEYAEYARTDDCKKPGYAKLKRVANQILNPGDVGFSGTPPHDIHENKSLTDAVLILASGGTFSPVRQYYDVNNDSFFEKGEKAKV